jgi:heme-degrading monooxygenase HmoA
MIVILWETKEAMEAGEASVYYRDQAGKFGSLPVEDVVREAYEVSVQA